MPLVAAAILPHGTASIPGFTEGKSDFSAVTRGMEDAAFALEEQHPRTIVIASPHNLRIKDNMAVVTTENCGGTLEQGRKKLSLSWKCDLTFAKSLFSLAEKRGLPVVSVNYGTSGGPESRMPLDWGTLVPLWFLPRRVRTVLVTPSREIPWSALVSFGECIREAASRSRARVAFIASADQGHAHLKSGPYGFDKAAAEYDAMVVSMVEDGRLQELIHIKPDFIEKAKPDSFWQMLLLAGVLKGTGLETICCSYSCPTYYGMLSAAFA